MKRIFIACFLMFSVSISVLGKQFFEDTIFIKELVVSGNRIEVDRVNAPLSISLISSAVIKNHEESNILPVVAKVTPSVFVSEIGVAGYAVGNGTSGQITIRGIGGSPNAQILTLVDGQPQYMGIFGHPLPNFHMASNVERVEVIRGPASLLYGSNAMGGVLNIITKQKGESDGVSIDTHLAYGSYNTSKIGASMSYQKKKLQLGLSFNGDKTNGHRDSSAFEMTNFHMYSLYQVNDNWSLNAKLTRAAYEFQDPGSEYNTNPDVFSGEISRSMITLSLKNTYEKYRGGVNAFYNLGEHLFSDGWESTDYNYGINMYEAISYWKGSTLTIGMDGKRYGGLASSGMNANTDLSVDEAAVYLVAEQEFLERLIVNGGFRYEYHSLFGGEVVPQIGMTWKKGKGTVLKGLISKGFRSPTIMELYLFMPNLDLGPEHLVNYELSIGQSISDRGRVAFTAFIIDGEDMISQVPNPDPGPPMKRVNVGEFRNMGFEFESAFYPVKRLRVDLNYSFLHCDVSRLFAPKNQLYTSLSYTRGKSSFSLSLKAISGLYSYIDSEVSENSVSQSYQLLDAKMRYRLIENLEIFIAGKNLLNQSYQTVYGYTMPGINVLAGLSFHI